jgi:hypothetical protein
MEWRKWDGSVNLKMWDYFGRGWGDMGGCQDVKKGKKDGGKSRNLKGGLGKRDAEIE